MVDQDVIERFDELGRRDLRRWSDVDRPFQPEVARYTVKTAWAHLFIPGSLHEHGRFREIRRSWQNGRENQSLVARPCQPPPRLSLT
jgi:hypothetical protein